MEFNRIIVGLMLGAVLWSGCDTSSQVARDRVTAPGKTPSQDDVNLIAVASRALSRNDRATADEAIRSQLLKDPNDAQALELAGDLARSRGDTETAITMYLSAVEQRESPGKALLNKLSEAWMLAGRPFETITVLERIIELYPDEAEPRFDLAGLATMLGLPRVAIPSLRWLAQHGHGDTESLQVLADPKRVQADEAMCQRVLKRCPQDLHAEFGLARLDAQKLNWQAVVQRLKPVLQRHPDFVLAHALYGRALVELNELDEIAAWQATVPAAAESSPEYRITAGLWAQQQGRHREAARAFWEALRLGDLNPLDALRGLSLCLPQIGRDHEAKIVADRLNKYGEMRDALKIHLERQSRSQQAALQVAEAMLALGRLWESEAWARVAVSLPEDRVPDIRERYLAIREQLTVDTPWQRPEMKIASRIDLSDLPQVTWVAGTVPRPSAGAQPSGRLFFVDQAAQRGWIHTCEIAPTAVQEGLWIYQTISGGVGVIDFDLDGWPDLAATTLNGNPLRSDSSPNRLFRNVGGQFVDCTGPANYQDTGFSQGITIGDYNDDGFPDIFDANIGRNRLYRNNGDGTFQEVSSPAGLSGELWTTSAVIADVDGDGVADLYEVDYCSGRKPYEQPCHNSRGISPCPPLKFQAEPDRLWRGVGDGTFVDVTDVWMNQSTPGRGLGVVAGLFDERPGLDLLVANDMTVNHLWSGGSADGGFRLTDLGAIRGVGYSGRSLAQASMGMAVGDPDGDGDIDFFVTHFFDDYNTYYEQVGPGLWTDRSFQTGLSQPSMKLLGFGTEWVDFDNNGTLELIVVNGHVVDRKDVAYRMPAQVHQRDASGRWIELDRKDLGDYFAADHLGRALATIDVDRDGRTDVAITHLFDPVSLLVNRTEHSGQSIGLELKSTSGQRDAIGATVNMLVGSRKVTAQLTAGDGYMCTNQRRLTIGMGEVGQARDVVVTWPTGATQRFGTLDSGGDYLLVEGSDGAHSLSGRP